jgi:hypothetical protein
MSLIRKLFLFAVFVASTYSWLVLFEFGPEGFKDGFMTYYTRFVPAEEETAPAGLPQAPPRPQPSAPVGSKGGPQKPYTP